MNPSPTGQPGAASPPPTEESNEYWLVRHARPILFVIMTLALVGAYVSFSIPIEVFPSTNFPRIIIGIDNGVAPIDQMMVTVTRPVEQAVNSVLGLQEVKSITSRGTAEVDLFFDWNVDMFQTLQRVNAAVARIRPTLPPDAAIDTHRLMFTSFPVIGYSLTSHTVPQTRLWEMATYQMAPRLNRINGIATVTVQGGQVPEYQIAPDPARLLSSSTTVTDLLDAVARTNVIESPGLLNRQHQLFLGLVNGQVRDAADLAGIVVKTTPAGVPVHIGDVAEVGPSVEPVYTIVTANAEPAVLLNINRQRNSNLMQVATAVHDEVAALNRTLPPGTSLQPFYDQSGLVSDSIHSVRDAILLGILLSSIILVLFLRDWGTSLVAGLVIPVTIAITFIAIKALGQSFNLMTLGGLAAAVGLVIDDAIVVVENIVLHRDAGQSRTEAIRRALHEITPPLIGSTITPIVVFLPLISITGVTGTFFRALAITMGVALATSLALALTWTPTLSRYLLHRKGVLEKPAGDDNLEVLLAAEEASLTPRFRKLVNWYSKMLRRALDAKRLMAIGSVALIALSYVCYKAIGSDLLPAMDEGGFVIDYVMPPGSSLNETNRVVSHIEQLVRAVPEVQGTSRRTGLQMGLAAVTEANTGDISVKLKSKRSRGVDEIMAELRHEIARAEPEVDIEFTQILQDNIGDLTGAPEPVVIKLFSPDVAELQTWAPKVGDAISHIRGVVDIVNGVDDAVSGPAVEYQVRPDVAARSGFTPAEVATDANALLMGAVAQSPVVANDRSYNIRVRFPARYRASLEAMNDTLLLSGAGHTATLGALADVQQLPSQMEILRDNLQRYIAVTARLQGRSMSGGLHDVQAAVAALHLPADMRVEYGGTYAQQKKSFHDLLIVLVLAIVLVFAVLLFEFSSFAAPTAILSSALLSLAGVFVALLVTGISFSITAFMGLIMVVGIVAKNGILLLDADQRFRAMGVDARAAAIQAGRRRLRPIVMTAMATVAGMLPLAFGIGAGSAMLQPLAVAVIGGLLISMVLSLIVTPAVHFWLAK